MGIEELVRALLTVPLLVLVALPQPIAVGAAGTTLAWLVDRTAPVLIVHMLKLVKRLLQGLCSIVLVFEYLVMRHRRRWELPTPMCIQLLDDGIVAIVQGIQRVIVVIERLVRKRRGLGPKVFVSLFLGLMILWTARGPLSQSQTLVGSQVRHAAIVWCSLEGWTVIGVWSPMSSCVGPVSSIG
jgi:hypothetical protein